MSKEVKNHELQTDKASTNKPWWKKLLNTLLKIFTIFLLVMILLVTTTIVLTKTGVIDNTILNNVFFLLGIPEQSYTVEYKDANEYFNNSSNVLQVIKVKESDDVLTEKEAYTLFEERGFIEYPILSDYTMDGEYYEAEEISSNSSTKHPTYTTYYVTENENIWTITIINDSIMATPVSYNMESENYVQTILSEKPSVTSYDSITNQFFETIPYGSELTIKQVYRIDSQTLEQLTNKEIDKL